MFGSCRGLSSSVIELRLRAFLGLRRQLRRAQSLKAAVEELEEVCGLVKGFPHLAFLGKAWAEGWGDRRFFVLISVPASFVVVGQCCQLRGRGFDVSDCGVIRSRWVQNPGVSVLGALVWPQAALPLELRPAWMGLLLPADFDGFERLQAASLG